MSSDSSRKTALVTGGTRGIGLGIARSLAADGWNVVLNGVRAEEAVEEAMVELQSLGAEVAYARGDIGSAEGRAAIVDVVRSAAGGALNLLVNNAGVAPKQRLDILETTEENYDFVVDTKLKGAFFLTQAIANDMVEAKGKDASFPERS